VPPLAWAFYTEDRIVPLPNRVTLYAVPSRRLEDRILRLCGQVVAVDADSSEFYALASELRSNLSEHIRRTRAVLAEYPASGQRRKQAEEGSDKRVRE